MFWIRGFSMHCVGRIVRQRPQPYLYFVEMSFLYYCLAALINNSGANVFNSATLALITRVHIFRNYSLQKLKQIGAWEGVQQHSEWARLPCIFESWIETQRHVEEPFRPCVFFCRQSGNYNSSHSGNMKIPGTQKGEQNNKIVLNRRNITPALLGYSATVGAPFVAITK